MKHIVNQHTMKWLSEVYNVFSILLLREVGTKEIKYLAHEVGDSAVWTESGPGAYILKYYATFSQEFPLDDQEFTFHFFLMVPCYFHSVLQIIKNICKTNYFSGNTISYTLI
jgi:hypothetical protein